MGGFFPVKDIGPKYLYKVFMLDTETKDLYKWLYASIFYTFNWQKVKPRVSTNKEKLRNVLGYF